MTDDEIELVAAELAKAGGLSWYPERERGPVKVIADRFRERARKVIEALDRHRDGRERRGIGSAGAPAFGRQPDDALQVGSTVVYRPPGDRRAYACRVEQVDGHRIFITPEMRTCTGWIDMHEVLPPWDDDAPRP